MRKTISIGLAVLALATFSYPAGKTIKLRVGYFAPADQVFRDVYGGGIKVGIEGSFEVAKNLDAWLGLDYFAKSGQMADPPDPTDVWIYPISAGVNYNFAAAGPVTFYLGAGIEYVLFKEENVLGTVNKGNIGFMAKAGGVLKLRKNVSLDVSLGYSVCSMTNEDAEFKVGGLDIGAGLAFRF